MQAMLPEGFPFHQFTFSRDPTQNKTLLSVPSIVLNKIIDFDIQFAYFHIFLNKIIDFDIQFAYFHI